MKRITAWATALLIGAGVSLLGATAANAATFECHVFQDGTVVCRPMKDASVQE